MFNKEIISIQKEITTLKENQRRTITTDDLIIRTAKVTVGVEEVYSDTGILYWNKSFSGRIYYNSKELPVLALYVERISGGPLFHFNLLQKINPEGRYIKFDAPVNNVSELRSDIKPVEFEITVYSLGMVSIIVEEI